MDFDETVVLRTFANETVARLAVLRLESQGIDALMQKDDCGGVYPPLQMTRGVRLRVKPEDLDVAKAILDRNEGEAYGQVLSLRQQEHTETQPSNPGQSGARSTKWPPSRQLDELKTLIYTYLLIAPLLSAWFALKIDSELVAFLMFVGLIAAVFVHLRNRFGRLEESLTAHERRLEELEGGDEERRC